MRRLATFGFVAALWAVPALAGLAALEIATHWGPGITPDTVVYVDAARHLAAGDGFVTDVLSTGPEPLTHYPPLYPMLLAAITALDIDTLAGARVLNMALFLANVFLVFSALRTAAPQSPWVPGVGALLMAMSWPLLLIHANLLAEPLFLCAGTAGLLMLGRFLECPRLVWLVASATCVGLALLSRYAAASFVVAGALALILLGREQLIRRMTHACIFSVLAALPLGLWLARGISVAQEPLGRRLDYHPIQAQTLETGIDTLASWLLMDGLPWWAQAGLLVGGAGVLLYLGARPSESAAENGWPRLKQRLGTLPALFAIFAATYIAFLLFSLTFVDAYTPLNHRILSPVFIGLLIVVLRTTSEISFNRTSWPHQLAAGALIALFAVAYVSQTIAGAARSRDEGLPGYGSRAWQESQLIDRITRLSDDTRIYTNGPDAIRILTGRSARWLPRKWNPVSRRPGEDLAEQLAAMQRDLAAGETLVVWFDLLSWRRYVASPKELVRSTPLRRAETFPDGAIFRSQ